MKDIQFELPLDFSEYELELASKGWFSDTWLVFAGKRYRLNFYDSARLAQEIESTLIDELLFFEKNLIVIPSVTRCNMERAVEILVHSGRVTSLLSEDS